MQVYPEPPGSSAATFASSTAGYDAGKPEGVSSTSQTLQAPPPPAYAPPAYEPAANAYGFNPSVTTAPAQYGAPSGYGVAPAGYGYRVGPVAPLTQLQNSQNVQLNVMHATASTPVVVTQPPVTLVSPSSFMGWSIFNFLCCCWPLGLAAIIYSTKVGSARTLEEAKTHSLTARNLNISATVIAPLLIIITLAAYFGSSAYVLGRNDSVYNSYTGSNYLSNNKFSYTAYASDWYTYYSYYYDSLRYTYYSYSYTAYRYSSSYYYYG